MLARAGHVLLILALLGATGTHWMFLQSVAWTSMLAVNLRHGTISEAVTRTFDGKNPCQLCNDIAAGKQAEKKSAFAVVKAKLEFITAQKMPFLQPPRLAELRISSVLLPQPMADRPPVPPPRSLAS